MPIPKLSNVFLYFGELEISCIETPLLLSSCFFLKNNPSKFLQTQNSVKPICLRRTIWENGLSGESRSQKGLQNSLWSIRTILYFIKILMDFENYKMLNFVDRT